MTKNTCGRPRTCKRCGLDISGAGTGHAYVDIRMYPHATSALLRLTLCPECAIEAAERLCDWAGVDA